jgi:hypothetical protein
MAAGGVGDGQRAVCVDHHSIRLQSGGGNCAEAVAHIHRHLLGYRHRVVDRVRDVSTRAPPPLFGIAGANRHDCGSLDQLDLDLIEKRSGVGLRCARHTDVGVHPQLSPWLRGDPHIAMRMLDAKALACGGRNRAVERSRQLLPLFGCRVRRRHENQCKRYCRNVGQPFRTA